MFETREKVILWLAVAAVAGVVLLLNRQFEQKRRARRDEFTKAWTVIGEELQRLSDRG